MFQSELVSCPFNNGFRAAKDMPRKPATRRSSLKYGGRGCGFAFLLPEQLHSLRPQLPLSPSDLHAPEPKALTDLLLPRPPQREETLGLKDADGLNPTDGEVLATALGAPARTVVMRAELTGPWTGWRDGHLSSEYGFCPPDPDASPFALAQSPGIFIGVLSSSSQETFGVSYVKNCQILSVTAVRERLLKSFRKLILTRYPMMRCGLLWFALAFSLTPIVTKINTTVMKVNTQKFPRIEAQASRSGIIHTSS